MIWIFVGYTRSTKIDGEWERDTVKVKDFSGDNSQIKEASSRFPSEFSDSFWVNHVFFFFQEIFFLEQNETPKSTGYTPEI